MSTELYLALSIYTLLFLINTGLLTFSMTVRGYKNHLLFALGIIPVIQIVPIIISLYSSNKAKKEDEYDTY